MGLAVASSVINTVAGLGKRTGQIGTTTVRRSFRPKHYPPESSIFTLVIFADASPIASEAVAYFRIQCLGKAHVIFVMAKGRRAPLKPIKNPRLELGASVLAVRLYLIIKQELRISISSVESYTDSQLVLYQLRGWLKSLRP